MTSCDQMIIDTKKIPIIEWERPKRLIRPFFIRRGIPTLLAKIVIKGATNTISQAI